MKLAIFRILTTLFIIVAIVLTANIIIGSLQTTVSRTTHEYTAGNESFAIAVSQFCTELSAFGDYTEFYETSYEEYDRTREVVLLTESFSDIILDNDTKIYHLTVPSGGECQLYAHYINGMSNEIRILDLVSGKPIIGNMDKLSLWDEVGEIGLVYTGEVREGLALTEPVELSFGNTYQLARYFWETPVTMFPAGKYDEVHFEVYNESGKRNDSALSKDKAGNISVTSMDGGYFKMYSDRTGGLLVPYTVSWENSPILDIVIESYKYETGIQLSPEEVTPEIMSSLTELETKSIPSFLTESLFDSLFPNIQTLRVYLDSDDNSNMLYTLPASLKHIELVNSGTNRVTVNASFTGTGSNTKMTVIGAVTVAGNGTDPTFSGFEAFVLEAGSKDAMSTRVEISSRNALTVSPDAVNVFSDIGALTLIANHAPLEIKAGAGATVTNALRSGNGGSAIVCKSLTVEADMSITVYGGRGGYGYAGKDGKEGYFVGEGENISAHRFNGTDGGNAGNGGCAVMADRIKITGSGTVSLYGGDGGNGGKGGNGGRGADHTKLGFWQQFWHGTLDGYGGDGGSGGNGGDGGYAMIVNEKLECYSTLNVYISNGGKAGGRGTGGYSQTHSGMDGYTDGTKGESYGYLVMSGVTIGNAPQEKEK